MVVVGGGHLLCNTGYIVAPPFLCRSLQRAHEHLPVRGLQEVLRPQALPRDAPQGVPQRAPRTPRGRRRGGREQPRLHNPPTTTAAAISGRNQYLSIFKYYTTRSTRTDLDFAIDIPSDL